MEVDLSYFHINVPEAVGTKYAVHSSELSEEDIRDMQPTLTDEEIQYFAKEEHIIELKTDMRKLGSAVYVLYSSPPTLPLSLSFDE